MVQEIDKNNLLSIFIVKIILTEKGFRYKSIDEIKGFKENNSSFIKGYTDDPFHYWVIKKNKILVPKLGWVADRNLMFKSFSCKTYCLDGDQDKAINIIKKHLSEEIMKQKSRIDSMIKYI